MKNHFSQPDSLEQLPARIAKLAPHFQKMYLRMPELVSRQEIYAHCSSFKPETIANRDCLGTGPKGKEHIGSKVYYPREEAICWLAAQRKHPELHS